MTVAIAGSRSLSPSVDVVDTMLAKYHLTPSRVICGCADGVDKSGLVWARINMIRVMFCPAWQGQRRWALSVAHPGEIVMPCPPVSGKGAGYVRNMSMASMADAVLILHDGKSPGSLHMRDIAVARGVPCFMEVMGA